MLTSAALESPDPKGCVEQDGDKASPSPSSLPTAVRKSGVAVGPPWYV